MSNEIKINNKTNLYGSLWMIASMGSFAIEDSLVKAASQILPVGQVLILFGLGGSFLFACFALLNKEKVFSSNALSSTMCIRMFFEIIGRLFYVISISLIPLSVATVILQATPLVVVAGATLVFGEKAGPRRWTAIIIGLIGVFIIVQPGADSFSVFSFLAIIGMLGFAGRDLASRAAPKTLGTATLGLYGFFSIIIAGILVTIWHAEPIIWPNLEASLLLFFAILAGVVAYSCLMKAMRTGEVSAVTPFRYTRLLFGIALGFIVFDEQLNVSMLLGSLLIIVSGVFIIWRSKQVEEHK